MNLEAAASTILEGSWITAVRLSGGSFCESFNARESTRGGLS
jgi:hypothetical protein